MSTDMAQASYADTVNMLAEFAEFCSNLPPCPQTPPVMPATGSRPRGPNGGSKKGKPQPKRPDGKRDRQRDVLTAMRLLRERGLIRFMCDNNNRLVWMEIVRDHAEVMEALNNSVLDRKAEARRKPGTMKENLRQFFKYNKVVPHATEGKLTLRWHTATFFGREN